MSKIIDFNGQRVEFPDSMSDDEINSALSSQEAPQATQPQSQPNTPQQPQNATESDSGGLMGAIEGAGRIAAGGLSNIANAGVNLYNIAGQGVQDLSNSITGEHAQFTPMAKAGYGEYDAQLQPRGAYEQFGADAIPYMVPVGEGAKVAEGAGRLAKLGASAVNAAGQSVLGSLAQNDTAGGVVQSIGENAAAGAVLEAVAPSVVGAVRRVLPESWGGTSAAENAAAVANPDYVQKVLQGGNETAQQTFRTATTDAEGNSIVLPSQALSGKYAGAEYRDLLRGENSQYAPVLAQQQSGEALGRAVNAADTGTSVKQSATDITEQFKKQASQLYNDSKSQAQSILNDAKVSQIKLQNTKELAAKHLADDSEMGKVNLNATTRKTLANFQKAKISDIDTLDKWKRALNEQANAQYRAGNHTASQALRDVSGSLRTEADSVISSINPEAGSIYRDADNYFSQSVGDFGTGKKSALGKAAANESESGATNYFVGNSQKAAERTQNAADALNGAIASGSLDDAARLSLDFSGAVGSATRNEAMRVAETGANFSPTKFANRLNQLSPQAEAASGIAGASDELAVNNALLDAVGMTRNKASNANRVTNMLSAIGSKAGGKVAGAVVGGFGGGAAGAIAGGYAGEKIAKAASEGLFDRLLRIPQRGQEYIKFLSVPENAKAVDEILSREGGLNATTDKIANAIESIVRPSAYATLNQPSNRQTEQSSGFNPALVPDVVEVPQRAQSYNAEQPKQFEPRVTKLYKALAHAETGGLQNRFIRTRAAEAGVSTAYGPAQLTVTTANDFYQRNKHLFNAQQRDYMKRFIEQGEQMKHADSNDSIYGYGGTGTLTSKQDKKLYSQVVRIMLDKMIKDNGGSLDKTVRQWRGTDDKAYFSKVREAFKGAA